MNRESLDKIKYSIQNGYNHYRTFQIKRSSKKGYKKIIKLFGEIKNPDPCNYIKYWNKLSSFVDPSGFQIYYKLHGIKDIQIVPNEVYYALIEPCLNDYTMLKAYKDKNNYERLFDRNLLPTTYLRNMAGVYYDREYQTLNDQQVRDILKALPNEKEKVMLKPSLITGMGNNVRAIDFKHKTITLDYLNEIYHHDFLIQEYIEQNEYFNQLGKENSIRLHTYRSVTDNSIFIHDAGIAIDSGLYGDETRYCSINESGKLGSFSLNISWKQSKTLPNSTIPFSTMRTIPKFNELIKIATDIALHFPYHRRLGLDMIVDKIGRVYIYEVNVGLLGFAKSQYLGGGLFKEYTDEIIEYCNINKSKISFPFTQ